ncbi:hypothetical protein [Alkalihalobacillus pseudalcaliphilus]|uniref:hypothetical protein n=1 Tax=Alkalihalobacillus pseudalcaliphilus TaxID=79884 RepID=UPI00064DB225|nr:hypothetical protein [Alkalihalobacillus pseudalcaliphilus]KMK76331.1 hypothetical protein AB990_14090 [Alkalihalobacillus pseudalcaliphilus]
MDVNDKYTIVELKLKVLNILDYLIHDELYTKVHAAKGLKKLVDYLDDMDQGLSSKLFDE